MSNRRRRGGGRRRPNSQERILGRDGTTSGPEAAVVAELRYLVGRVERRHGALPSVVGVLSAIVDEGVTFTTHALAAVLSTDFERSVCVVSLDWGSAGQGSINDLLAPWSEAARSLRSDDELAEELAADRDHGSDDELEPAGSLGGPGAGFAGVDEKLTASASTSTNGSSPDADTDVADDVAKAATRARASIDDLDDLEEPWADDDDDEVVVRSRSRKSAAADDEDEVWTGEALGSHEARDASRPRARSRAGADERDGADDDPSVGELATTATDIAGPDDEEPGTLPVLSDHQEVDLTWGIADVVRGSVTVDEVLVDTGRPRLWAVPSGVVLVDERPRMANHRGLRDVVADLGQRFDHVLLDLPPVLDASESLPLAGLADACVLVVAQGSTPVRDVQDAQTELTGIRLLGAVLNRSRTKTPNAIVRRFVSSD